MRDGKLAPEVGHEDEIKRVLWILARRTKSTPALIGRPGGASRYGHSREAHGEDDGPRLLCVREILKDRSRTRPWLAHRRHEVPGRVRAAPETPDRRGQGEIEKALPERLRDALADPGR